MLEKDLPKTYFVLLETTEGEVLKLNYGTTKPTQGSLDTNLNNLRPGQGVAICEIYESAWRRINVAG